MTASDTNGSGVIDGSEVTADIDVPPHILARGWNYARAWLRWSTAGFPVRDAAEVERLRGICAACPHFNGTICMHRKCGCRVVTPGWWGDKLKWATERCPGEKW